MDEEPDTMSARNEENEQADDVATLYSWANLHGAKYRDFSASRQAARAEARQRAIAEQARLAREEAQKASVKGKDEDALWQDVLPSVSRQMAFLASRGEAMARRETGRENGNGAHGGETAARESAPEAEPSALPRRALPVRESVRELLAEKRDDPWRENGPVADAENGAVRPAWLAQSPAAHPATPHADTGTLQQSRERVASRWFALRGILGKGGEEVQPEQSAGRVPVLAVFSLAGGVGKTSLVANLARGLTARGERVLLMDTCPFGVLPFYFGAREIKPGVLRTFSGGTSDPPVRLLTLDTDREGGGDADLLRREMTRGAQDATRVLMDVATGSAAMLRQALRFAPVVLVPVVPDMTSVVTLQSLEAFFRNQESATGQALQVWYVLNQFDASLPLHLDVREVLRQQLGERLLPFAIHRSMAVSEAMAEGMTVLDYAPHAPAAEDIVNLVTWVRNTSAVATGAPRAMRWSER